MLLNVTSTVVKCTLVLVNCQCAADKYRFFCHDKIKFASRETSWGILQKKWNDMIDAFNSIFRYLDDFINIDNILNSYFTQPKHNSSDTCRYRIHTNDFCTLSSILHNVIKIL